MAKESILVIRGGAIGDFVLTLPVLAALRAHFPEHRLEVLGNPRIARLAQYGGDADRESIGHSILGASWIRKRFRDRAGTKR